MTVAVMSAATDCSCACPSPVITEVPGSPGENGTDGAAGAPGENAFTTLTADLTLPAVAGPVGGLVQVANATWGGVGQTIFISDGAKWAHFSITTVQSATEFTLDWLDYPGDAAGASTLSSGSTVSPAGIISALAAPLPTALTDNSTGTPSNTIATLANQRLVVMSFPILLTSLDTPADLVTDLILPFKGAIISWQFVTEVVATSGGTADANVELQLGATTVTGSPTNLTQANFGVIGEVKAGGTPSALNTFNAGATFSIVCTSSAVNFTAGKINAYITFADRDDILIDAIASLADHINDLITSLT